MDGLGRTVPIHYQELFRQGYGDWKPEAEDFLADLRGAGASGASGWCFHQGSGRRALGGRPRRSFDLREAALRDQLDVEERRFLEKRSYGLPARP